MAAQKRQLSSYYFRVLKETDGAHLLELFRNDFISDEPIFSSVYGTPEEKLQWPKGILEDSLKYGVSLGVFDKESDTLVAYLLNLLGRHSKSHKLVVKQNVSLAEKQVAELGRRVQGDDLSEVLGTTDYCFFLALCCHADHRCKGLATEIFRRSESLVRELGVKTVCVEASSHYTQRIAKKLGFRRVSEIFYKDYIDPCSGEKIFAGVKEPHLADAFYVKDL